MNKEQIIEQINNVNQDYHEQFALLKNVSNLVNEEGNENSSRELVLRVLDKRGYFQDYDEILDSLVRQVGLIPYMDEEHLGLKDSLAYEFFKPIHDDGEIVFHRAQAEVYHKLLNGENVILSAPTSFGKSKIVDSIIELDRFTNIAVVVPTIALIDETRRRLSTFSERYKIVTQITQEPGERNIFLFTAERINAYENLPKIEFFVIDEFYKIGDLAKNKDRTISLNQAFYKLLKMKGQFYLLGPNIQHIPDHIDEDLNCSFYNTSFATVVSEVMHVDSGKNELGTLGDLLLSFNEQTLVYCKSPNRVNVVAHHLRDRLKNINDQDVAEAAQWVGEQYHEDWIYPNSLLKGVALHHGRLPRSLAQVSVRFFNDKKIKYLICTSTLIEGVNTSAKNIVIFDHKIGNKKYDYFTFNNIKGRGGRMFQHFIGHVYLFNAPPQEELPFVDFPFYSQGEDVPESLLIQLDEDDLNDESKDRVAEFYKQDVLPVALLKKNSAIDPSSQIELAELIESLNENYFGYLLWDSYPSYDQLKFCCELIWDHFVKQGKSGIYSASQLTLKVFSLYKNQDIKERILDELKPSKYAAKDPDDAVERILDFDRNWAGYTFPRLLMVLDSIQHHILINKYGRCGNYSFFASNVESLFRKSSLIALEEFGLPLQMGEKIDARINLSENVDQAIIQLHGLHTDENMYSHFERDIINDVKEHI